MAPPLCPVPCFLPSTSLCVQLTAYIGCMDLISRTLSQRNRQCMQYKSEVARAAVMSVMYHFPNPDSEEAIVPGPRTGVCGCNVTLSCHTRVIPSPREGT
ncbi:hypothetical protein F4821DRAFT_35167 [Hypoxylon rubiginosum]|uniref:Uncharacterized protein n=1 Tax=Hypoxylon rubiginosum TaxID=110542 RepID=A0ACC0CL54_9PEZI|nr:hypothetical protein F4821DRAFT_35167 [Hypoxylon rubiginosum]